MKEKRNAYVTFVMRNDSFIPGALVLTHSIKKYQTQHDLVCLITISISSQGKSCLEQLYDKVIPVDEIYLEHPNSIGRSDRFCTIYQASVPTAWSKRRTWNRLRKNSCIRC